jgi:hypothetical protein
MDTSNTSCKTTVINLSVEDCDVYIGRPSIFGNPFIIGKDGTREEVIQKYREWILTQPQILDKLQELRGKKLGCWCSPKKCHGDVLVELIHADDLKDIFIYV